MRRIAIAILLIEALLFMPEQALAFCRTTTCDRQDAPSDCTVTPGTCNTLGTPIAWPNTCVSTSVSAQGSVNSHITADQMRDIVQAAFQQWTSVNCGSGAPPNFVVDMFPDVNCTNVTEMTGDAGYKPTGPNYNLWLFYDTGWPYGNEAGTENAIALTTTQFNPTTGEIYDSDVELDAVDQTFTTDLSNIEMDLPSVVQHESGHFLGLAHTSVTTATMYAYLNPGDTSMRILDPDDKAAICATYPPGQANPNCDPEPRHGFSTECEFAKSSSCTMDPGGSAGRNGSWGAILMGLLLTAGACRRTHRKHPGTRSAY